MRSSPVACHVLEGASLGGRAVIPVLHRRLGISKDSGAAFFAGDEETERLQEWAVVIEWLEGLERTGVTSQPIVAAANATFVALACWVDGQEPSWSRRNLVVDVATVHE